MQRRQRPLESHTWSLILWIQGKSDTKFKRTRQGSEEKNSEKIWSWRFVTLETDVGHTINFLLRSRQGSIVLLKLSLVQNMTPQQISGLSHAWCSKWPLAISSLSRERDRIMEKTMTTLLKWWSYLEGCRSQWPTVDVVLGDSLTEQVNYEEFKD